MAEPSTNYRREFFTSPHHVWLGLLTVGLGFLSAQPLALVAGATGYALGWLYVPDLPTFQRWVDGKHEAARRAAALAQLADFARRRDALLASLSPDRRSRYAALADVCHDIERNVSGDLPAGGTDPAVDPRLRKLDELMWTYLRLLGIDESLERFLETERREDLPRVVAQAQQEASGLAAEVASLKGKDAGGALEAKQRLLGSVQERLEVLKKRSARVEQANQNVALVDSEQDRLVQQVKLIRADAVATKNADALAARIDATVEHLDQTNKWLSELDEFKDLVGDMPATDLRVGFEPAAPAAAPKAAAARGARVPVGAKDA
jgi:hypothetical protein